MKGMRSANPSLVIRAGERVDYKEYAALLRDSKLVVSPWGQGESSWRDYEATVSRAVLIKPMADSLKSYPDIYEAGVTCVKVRACLPGCRPRYMCASM